MHRLYSLDYLRGLAASAVLVYHYHLWETPQYVPHAASFLDRLGLYGVSLFYILSGFTLARVYHTADWSKKEIWATFVQRRIFRILPLLIVVTIISAFTFGKEYSLTRWILNITGLFGYFDPGAYMAIGAWSIGNEWVFYGIFPWIMWVRPTRWSLVLAICWGLAWLIVPFIYLDAAKSLPDQWDDYIQPLYQALFFAGGIILSYLKPLSSALTQGFLLVTAIALLVFFPVSGGHVALVVQIPKLVLGSACLALVFSVSAIPAIQLKPVHLFFKTLGDWSYGIYLWHPLVVYWLSKPFIVVPDRLRLIVFFGTVILVSGLSYHLFEKQWVRWGKRIPRFGLNNS